MAVNVDNLDEVIKAMVKMEKAVELEVIREVRRKMYAVMRSLQPDAKKISPIDTGELQKSVKVQSRSKRGITKVRLVWKVPYAGPLNFRKTTKKKAGVLGINIVRETERANSVLNYASDHWKKVKAVTDAKGETLVKDTMKEVLEKHGVKVENR